MAFKICRFEQCLIVQFTVKRAFFCMLKVLSRKTKEMCINYKLLLLFCSQKQQNMLLINSGYDTNSHAEINTSNWSPGAHDKWWQHIAHFIVQSVIIELNKFGIIDYSVDFFWLINWVLLFGQQILKKKKEKYGHHIWQMCPRWLFHSSCFVHPTVQNQPKSVYTDIKQRKP